MKTKQIISILGAMALVFLWSCEKDIVTDSFSDESLELRAKGGKGKPDDGPLGIVIQDLGTLGGDWAQANGVNFVDGIVHVVGTSYDASGDRHGFQWTEVQGMVDLGYLLAEYPHSWASDINTDGTITGSTQGLALTWSALNPGLGPTSINPANSVGSSAEAINIHGDIAGSRVDTCGYEGYGDCGPGSPGNGISIRNAFIWKSDGSYIDLETLGAESRALGINDNGLAIGYSSSTLPDPNGEDRAVIWQNGNLTIIPGMENLWSWAYDINNAGQIVGEFDTLSGSNTIRGFISDQNEFGQWETTKLPTLGTRTIARAISESGYITGTTYVTSKGRTTINDGVPFLYREDIGMFNLESNNKGQRRSSHGYDIIEKTDDIIIVVGQGNTQSGRRAMMWTVDLCLLIPERC